MSRPKPGQVREAAGRYRHIYSALWARRDFQALSPNARLVYLNLRTGTQSNLAGIGHFYREALEQETGLDSIALEAALCELEKMPTPARSWIVREGSIIWVRDHLNDSPAREGDPNIANSKHRAAIGYILGTLPADSPVKKKFRRYYNLGTDRVSHALADRPSHTPSDSPEIGDRRSEKETEIGEGDGHRRGRAREGGPGGVLAKLAPPSPPGVPSTDFQSSSEGRNTSNGVGTAARNDDEARAKVLRNVAAMIHEQNPTLPQTTIWREGERLVKEQREKWAGASWNDIFKAVIGEVERMKARA